MKYLFPSLLTYLHPEILIYTEIRVMDDKIINLKFKIILPDIEGLRNKCQNKSSQFLPFII
jgi:hypothetical protein